MLAVGGRVIPRLEEAGKKVEVQISFPRSLDKVAASFEEILHEMDRWLTRGRVDRVVLFHNRPLSGSSYEPAMNDLLPDDPGWVRELAERQWPSRSLPLFTMEWHGLFSSLLRQYFFVVLYRAFAHSLASENAARLAAMQAAERNTEEHIEELTALYHHERQGAITAELLDIVAGFETLVARA